MTTQYTELFTRIETLTNKMLFLAHAFGRDEWEDVYHNILVALMEAELKNPEFHNQNDSYILHCARISAWKQVRVNKKAEKFVEVIATDDDGETQINDMDLYPSNYGNPERIYMIGETLKAVVTFLSENDVKVLEMAIVGYTPAEIAKERGVSTAAISQAKSRIAKAISQVKQA